MKFLPATLVSRTVLVLLAGLVVSNLVGLQIYNWERDVALTTAAGDNIARRVASVTRTVSGLPVARRAAFICDQSSTLFVATLNDVPLIEENVGNQGPVFSILFDLLDQPQAGRLRVADISSQESDASLEPFVRATSTCDRPMGMQMPNMDTLPNMDTGFGTDMMRMMLGHDTGGFVQVAYQIEDGSWLNILAAPSQRARDWNPRFLVAFLVTTLIVTLISVWAVRRSTRPLAQFARASERLGRDMNAPDMPETGPREVNLAARAFNDMQKRLRKIISDRTQMLAAVSHDLRTPVTRLRLRAEFIEDEDQRTKMLNDLAQMEAMISATLSFARLDSSEEELKRLDLAGLVQSVVDDSAEMGHEVSYEGPTRVSYLGRPLALRRVFDNLLDNAIKYGKRAKFTLRETDEAIVVNVLDEGPGIPEDRMAEVFEPFFRLESSRNRETGGAGLGLAVVRSIVEGHGGTLKLANRKEGGLNVTLIFPKVQTGSQTVS